MLQKSPLFTSVAIASLALGLGANTSIFNMLDQAILRPLPVKNPRELALIAIMFIPGNQGPNRYGPDMLGPAGGSPLRGMAV